MTTYKLTKEDLADFKNILSITESVEEHYQNLEKLELEGKKDTEEYKRELTFLKSTLALENSLYGNFYTNVEKPRALMDYLMENKKVAHGLDILKVLVHKPSDFKYQRIMQKLNYFLLTNKEYATMIVPELTKYVMPSSEYQKLLQQNRGYFLLQATAKTDSNRVALTILGRKLNSQLINIETKEKIISSLYNFSFLLPEIEEILIQNSFQIPETAYISLDMVKSAIELEKETIEDLLKNSYIMSAEKIMGDILEISDTNYKSTKGKHIGIIHGILLRATLQFIDEETIMELNDKFHSYIESDEYLEKHLNDSESIKIIIDAFKSYKKDKQIVAKLSLKL